MLTAKQEAFALALASGKGVIESYSEAYSVKPGRTSAAVSKDANAAMTAAVRERVEQLRMRVADRVAESMAYELDDAMAETAQAFALALSKENPAAMARIIELRAKLNGLLVAERKNERTPVQGLSHDEAKAAFEALVAIRKARGSSQAA